MTQIRTIIVALISAVCGRAGALALNLPPSPLQQGAATVATVCEANGFAALSGTAPTAPGATSPTPTGR